MINLKKTLVCILIGSTILATGCSNSVGKSTEFREINADYEIKKGTGDGFNLEAAYVSGVFDRSGRETVIEIDKLKTEIEADQNSRFGPKEPWSIWSYELRVLQKTNENPIDVKSVTVFSANKSISFDIGKESKKSVGLEYTSFRIFNISVSDMESLINDVDSKILIRITATNGTIYDFYPSEKFISYLKKVAHWS